MKNGDKTMIYPIFQAGHRVRIASYGPFRGLIGTIRIVDTIIDLAEPFCFYQIELEGAFTKEPVWFEYDEVEPVSPYECEYHLSAEHEHATKKSGIIPLIQ
jgi:hypothetical protein